MSAHPPSAQREPLVMPTDTTTEHLEAAPPPDRALPAGAGVALAVLGGTAIWAGVLALFLI